jgi:hypothetical protein
MFYEANSNLQVHGYTDADWVDIDSNRRLTNGSCFLLEVVLLVGAARITNIYIIKHISKIHRHNNTTCEVI